MDARVRYTQTIIKKVFLELLKTKPISKITVKEICSAANVNRATFYKYYDNAYDLLDKIENEVLDHLEEEIASLKGADLPNLFRVIVHDILEQKEKYQVLFSENGDELFKNRLFEHCYRENMLVVKKYFPELPEKYQEWLYYFVAEGCNGILSQWMKDGMKESPDQIIQFLIEIIESVNRSKFSKI